MLDALGRDFFCDDGLAKEMGLAEAKELMEAKDNVIILILRGCGPDMDEGLVVFHLFVEMEVLCVLLREILPYGIELLTVDFEGGIRVGEAIVD